MDLKPNKAPLISVVFSFRNEALGIAELVKRCRKVMAELRSRGRISNHELIFVNDASTDNSVFILMELAAELHDIRILNMSRNFGVAPCVMAGLAYARGEVVVYMDADLQDPPEIIPEMLAAWQAGGVDVVHTVRRSRQGEPALKLWVTGIGYAILNRYCAVKIPKEAGDFKLLSRRVVDHLLTLKEQNPFMRGLVSWVGFRQVFISYDRAARFSGASKFFVLSRKVISNFFNSAIVNFSAVPLQIASYLGLTAIFVDLFFIGHVLIEKLAGRAIPGWTAIMTIVLFIGGIQLFCVGMIGLYLNAVHEQSKMRPRYIVESTYGFPGENGGA
ncbi:MAG: glycosyltransferase family 2 protein [Candidatus Omnitrophica bacterium]|nr:glycosyltransferase family 2 protein [Candidatus Omnitrophota bacterium]